MKYVIGALCAIVITMAFIGRKCEHVFTQVEREVIKIERHDLFGASILPVYSWPTGLQEGKDLICVKCFLVQKQVLDYGEPCPQQYNGINIPDTWRSSVGTDTCNLISSRSLFIKGDSLIWSK